MALPKGDGDKSFEVELKFRLPDPDALRQRLKAAGFALTGQDQQEDVYLRHPERDFGRTHEAFRMRRHGSENLLTYKGPKHDGPTKTREEIELGFAPGVESWHNMLQMLERLGFSPVASVSKHREQFAAADEEPSLLVVIDHVEGLGYFAEVEALIAGAGDLPAAQAAVLDTATRLGLETVEPRSYLRIKLEQARKSPGPL